MATEWGYATIRQNCFFIVVKSVNRRAFRLIIMSSHFPVPTSSVSKPFLFDNVCTGCHRNVPSQERLWYVDTMNNPDITAILPFCLPWKQKWIPPWLICSLACSASVCIAPFITLNDMASAFPPLLYSSSGVRFGCRQSIGVL